jgi:hypothetical protein
MGVTQLTISVGSKNTSPRTAEAEETALAGAFCLDFLLVCFASYHETTAIDAEDARFLAHALFLAFFVDV